MRSINCQRQSERWSTNFGVRALSGAYSMLDSSARIRNNLPTLPVKARAARIAARLQSQPLLCSGFTDAMISWSFTLSSPASWCCISCITWEITPFKSCSGSTGKTWYRARPRDARGTAGLSVSKAGTLCTPLSSAANIACSSSFVPPVTLLPRSASSFLSCFTGNVLR